MKRDRVVLSIGTTHPWNIAGVGLDLVLGHELGVRVLTVVAAISAQDAHGVHAMEAVSPELLQAQLDAIPWETVNAMQIGILGSAENIRVVAKAIRAHPVPCVLDPVITASLGGTLANDAAVAAIRSELVPLPSLILTPNLDEAERLLGHAIDRDSFSAAATELRNFGCCAVLLKGGHLEGDPVDVLATAEDVVVATVRRLRTSARGTGSTLAMAIACELARGSSLSLAVDAARTLVREAIAEHRTFASLQVTR